MDKTLSYLALARKAGKAELGEEPVGAVTRAGKGVLVLVAQDASEHTWRRAASFVAGTNQQCLLIPYSKDEMGQAIGRTSLAIAAITDPALALALVKALPESKQTTQALEALTARTQRPGSARRKRKPTRKTSVWARAAAMPL